MNRIVSIVVPCRNERAHIGALLDSIAAQETAGFELEVIVADGRSDDGTRELIAARRHPNLRLIDNPGRIVSTGLNAAIRAARGDIIVRMDAHAEYAPDYVRRCVEAIDRTGADNVGGPWRAEAGGYIGAAIAAAFESPFGAGTGKAHRGNHEGPVDTVYLGCWRRDAFARFGDFDEELIRNQDDEFNLRILRNGGRVWQSAAIVSRYRTRDSLGRLFRQYFQYGFWKVAVIRKHGVPASWRHVVPCAFVLGLVVTAIAALAGTLAGPSFLAALGALAFALAAGPYALAVGAASLLAGRKHGWTLLPVLPAVFAAYHFAYGLGFVAGLLLVGSQRVRQAPLFSGVSR